MDRLKKKRAVRRSRNTKLINEIRAALQSDPMDYKRLEMLRDRLLAGNDELRKVNEEIEPLFDDNDLEKDYNTVADFEDEVASISNSIFSSVVFFFIYAVFKRLGNVYHVTTIIIIVLSLVLIVLFKFYYHHLRKVKNGQPLYTPYDLGVHRQHRHMYASPEKPFVSKFLIPSKHSAETTPAGPRHPTSGGSFHAE
ncbi:hypothetical protein HPB47_007716 [Ixodes persulcatus]|uniref:Uncharacterized protein n=1 Tax=Ixodes persulcatus TaxID=34615 RepID=A0AC60P7G6_IXOPE|nr:hypothetical protein HPB47_007716 [Ixodes persulcatus]